jgi:hypothetical protein
MPPWQGEAATDRAGSIRLRKSFAQMVIKYHKTEGVTLVLNGEPVKEAE